MRSNCGAEATARPSLDYTCSDFVVPVSCSFGVAQLTDDSEKPQDPLSRGGPGADRVEAGGEEPGDGRT